MVIRIDGPCPIVAIPLLPGTTYAPKLDTLARQYSWVKWVTSPKLVYRALNSVATDGVWYHKVIHDATSDQLLQNITWNIASRDFSAQKACQNFEIDVPLQAMVTTKYSPLNSDRCSYVICAYKGEELPLGEFWLHYSVDMGGAASPVSPSVTYEVKNGVFLDPTDGSPMDGIPLAPEGRTTSYHFDSAPQTRQTTKEFVNLSGGTPMIVTRGSGESNLIDKSSRVTDLTIANPTDPKLHKAQQIMDLVSQGVEAANDLAPLIKSSARKLGRGSQWAKRRLQFMTKRKAIAKSEDDEDLEIGITGPFSNYNGYVTVSSGFVTRGEIANVASSTPIFVGDGVSAQARIAVLPFLGSLLGGIATAVIPEVVASLVHKAINQPRVVHKGMDAVSFVYDSSKEVGVDEGDGDGDEDGGENPLPEIPDFDDVGAPGQFVPWETTNRHFGGFVTDDNGTPIVRWLGCTYAKKDLHLSAPGAKYYYNDRMPWDQESKRMLGCYVNVDREMDGMFLLLHCVNWGDDSCGHWVRNLSAGTYLGTVARFAGLAESRSVIQIKSAEDWNKEAVQLLIGQSKEKYYKDDKGRACMFYCSIGAVADADVAKMFLTSFDSSGKNEMVNVVGKKNSGLQNGTFNSVSDIVIRSRESVPAELEPTAPGFAKNYKTYAEAKKMGMIPRALPVAIEAGPIRGMMLARFDDANGWWQHIPYCTLSYTSLSSRWTYTPLLGTENSETLYTKPTTDYGTVIPAVRINPPKSLTSGAVMCIEVIAQGGGGSWCSEPCKVGAYNNLTFTHSKFSYNVRNAIATPIHATRTVADAQSFDIYVHGDSSRPTTAVDGYSGDLYVALSWTIYLLKDKEAALLWATHDLEPSQLTGAEIEPAPSSGALGGSYNKLRLYKCVKDVATNTYLPDVNSSWAVAAQWSSLHRYENCPLYENNPLYSKDGRAIETSSWSYDRANEVVLEPPPMLGEEVESPVLPDGTSTSEGAQVEDVHGEASSSTPVLQGASEATQQAGH